MGDLSNIEVGFLSAIPPLLGVIGTIVLSRSSDRTGDRKFHLAGVYLLAAVAMLGSAYVASPVLAFVFLCIVGFLIFLFVGLMIGSAFW